MTELVGPGILGQIGKPQQPGTIGRAAPGYRLRIAGASRDLQPGDAGELEVLGERGRTLFTGYFSDEAATREAFTGDGWFRTGDRVRVHGDGSVTEPTTRDDLLRIWKAKGLLVSKSGK